MAKENLYYWYDKNGNKVYGDPKKYNKFLEYLMSNNPEDVVSKQGLIIRKAISPVYRSVVNVTTSNKFHIEKESKLHLKRPIIFASTHGFRDDVALAIKTAGKHAYVLYGSIPDFYYSIDGIALWINGVVIVDRKDKKSRAAALEKMSRVIDLGGNMLIFPEGVWNKSKNELVLKLFPGVYKLAKQKNAIIVPIASIQVDNNCYSKRMAPIDITKYDEEEALYYLRNTLATGKLDLMMRYANISWDDVSSKDYWKNYIDNLISTANGLYDYEIENSAEYIDKDIINEKEVFEPLDKINVNTSNAHVFSKTSNICKKM